MGLRTALGLKKRKPAPTEIVSEMVCNICDSNRFVEFRGRGAIQCGRCKSVERTRVLKLVLDSLDLRKGSRVLHMAPERGIREYLRDKIGEESYKPVDYNPAHFSAQGFPVTKFDLVRDSENLPSDHFDLVLHSHVIEHLRCNYTAVLWHLHRSLSPQGLHVFAVPIMPGKYEADFGADTEEERNRRFGNIDHVRNFGRDDLHASIGMIFDVQKPDMAQQFGAETLRKHNIPETAWSRFSGSSFFVLGKRDLKLDPARYV